MTSVTLRDFHRKVPSSQILKCKRNKNNTSSGKTRKAKGIPWNRYSMRNQDTWKDQSRPKIAPNKPSAAAPVASQYPVFLGGQTERSFRN